MQTDVQTYDDGGRAVRTDDAIPQGWPSAEWLERRLGAGALVRPDEADLPGELTNSRTREFLLTVGFPAVDLEAVGLDATHLRGEDRWYAFDADEIYGERYPDDDSPPKNFCYTVLTYGDQHLMLGAESGAIIHYDPNGWDHGAGWQGPAASSLPSLAVLLGLMAESAEALDSPDDAVRVPAAGALRERMIAHDADVEDSDFWQQMFEDLGWEGEPA
ncbi:SUKH-4 family immunity protein [Streptomyces sp. Da 82-17]|uniref:SUKH-4 family immunity protein n=1 Tax=Streptomyces sp. Da 82-17 TaxID=3377116 RepID=UPI0038D37332